ncbi:uncharacterized protein CC84DRAFT_1162132 [Paraphaeosphaeria sporulosa]|uniref:Uncharacterized protein n=1 Tax=Paraphaeosphaeria sporulosa TaxID=1460663 RepID=A0A177CMY8_9PLEO|nr:uncharacterized protein CC84DRAFT_1162132 [Paraphaeosphaeria sporulosa]OAG08137.1 hypothetical protein CC84DRAFT_1162132 [Paraphaeosphaeria sporulosa]
MFFCLASDVSSNTSLSPQHISLNRRVKSHASHSLLQHVSRAVLIQTGTRSVTSLHLTQATLLNDPLLSSR